MSYVFLFIAILTELAATTMLKYTEGFTKLLPTLACLFFYLICFYTFAKALTNLNLGAAYATWSGIGIIASAILSWVLFNERLNMIGILGIILIITGCIILNMFGVVQK